MSSGSISDPYNNLPPTDKDKNVLGLIFGESNCKNDWFTKFIYFFAFALIATFIFWILSKSMLNNYMIGNYNLGVKVLIFFILIFLLDWLFTSWRESQPICK
jgi:hypothetical protein